MTFLPFRSTTAELLDEADDFTLFDELGGRVQNRIFGEEKIPLGDLSVAQRTILLVWEATIIDNGGFQLLLAQDYPGDPGFVYMAAAFKSIRCDLAVRAFAEMLALFPGNSPPRDLSLRERLYLAVPEIRRKEIDGLFFDAGPSIETCAARYIRANRSDFLNLPPP